MKRYAPWFRKTATTDKPDTYLAECVKTADAWERDEIRF